MSILMPNFLMACWRISVNKQQGKIRILGIDPGSIRTGYGIIDSDGYHSSYVSSGFLKLPTTSLADKLGVIFASLSDLCQQWQPEHMAVEEVFMAKNPMSALKLGHARGAAISAGCYADLEIYEYTAKQVKKSAVGYGAASKDQMQHMVTRLLNLRKELQEDEADGLAVAICHAHTALNTKQINSS